MPNKLPRGIRNNNPGNIRCSPTKWAGETGDDGVFEIYDTPEHGIRALAKILLAYYRRYGLRTVEALIHRWAPPMENDTDAYVEAVAHELGVEPTQPIDVASPGALDLLARAIIRHENGMQPYPQAVIAAGVAMALDT